MAPRYRQEAVSTDNRDEHETWLILEDESVVTVDPFDLFLNMLENCPDVSVSDLEAVKEEIDKVLFKKGQ